MSLFPLSFPMDPLLEQTYYSVAEKAGLYLVTSLNSYDEVDDCTYYNWLCLYPGSDPLAFVDSYLALKCQRDGLQASPGTELPATKGDAYGRMLDSVCKHSCLMLVLSSEDELDLSDDQRAQLISLCKENCICLVHHHSHDSWTDDFLDLLTGKTWQVYVSSERWGSVDDAATYGTIKLRISEP